MSITGDRIKELRIKNGWTQEELGEKLGIKKAAINKYETGIVENIKRQTLLELAEILGTTPNYLMGWEDEKNKQSDSKIHDSLQVKEDEAPYLIAAHALEDLTEDEQKQILEYANFIRSKRNKTI